MLNEDIWWWLTEYATDIYKTLRELESNRISVTFKSPQLEWRSHTIHVIRKIAKQFSLLATTKHLAVFILDVFMDNHNIEMWRLHLVALTSIWLAAKIEENKFKGPDIQSLNSVMYYAKEDYHILETVILKMFDWDVNVPTAATFCVYFVEFIASAEDFKNYKHRFTSENHMRSELKTLAMSFLELSLFDCVLQHKILPSKLAAVCLAASRYKHFIKPIWTKQLADVTYYSLNDLEPEMNRLLRIQLTPAEKQLVELKAQHYNDLSLSLALHDLNE